MASRLSPLWQISVATTAEAEEAVADLLETQFARSPAVYTDSETEQSKVTVYVDGHERLGLKLGHLRQGLDRIRACDLSLGAGRITIRKIQSKDWAEAWKRHFKPFEIWNALLIRPSWSRKKPRGSQQEVILDPGLSFGTGHHPTTRFCLEQLAKLRASGQKQALLDLGAGSGILSIAGAKLGYWPVDAIDCDAQAVRIARKNAGANNVRVRIQQADLANLPKSGAKRYEVICANLTADILIAERERIVSRRSSKGVVVLAGMLKQQFEEVEKAFEKAGLERTVSMSDKEWRSGVFQ